MASSIYDLSRGPSFAGILSYTSPEGVKKELKTDQFWSKSYLPTQQEMSIYLKIKGISYYQHQSLSYVRVM
jgi:hypothetical protein